MKKKALSLLLTMSILLLTLAGCGTKEDTAKTTDTVNPSKEEKTTETKTDTPAAEKVTIKWALWDQEAAVYWKALKAAYEEKNPNVTVELVDLGSTDYMTVLATELSGSGSDLDVVKIKDVPGYATLVQKNVIRPLRPIR